MASDPISNRDPEIEHQAAAWTAKRDLGMTAAEQDEFFQWLAADPRHGEWLARQQETVSRLKVLAQWRPEHASDPNPDLLAAQKPLRRRILRFPGSRGVRWLVPLGLAAAACMAVLLWRQGGALGMGRGPDDQGSTVRKVLVDGSTVDLIHGAEVSVNYSAHQRDVTLLRGEARFTVTKNPNRPFVVSANGVLVRAVGTAFAVDIRSTTVEVLVSEGRVQVTPRIAQSSSGAQPNAAPQKPPIVEAGQRVSVSLGEPTPPSVRTMSASEMSRLLAWRPRQLEFNDTPLAQVVAEFNAGNRVKIVVDDPSLASIPIGASLHSDNVEGFVRVLEAGFDIKAERRSDGVIVLRRAN